MKKLWIALADRFDARSPRERLLVFLGLSTSIGLVFFLAIFQPAFSRYQSGLASVRQSETELRALATQELALIQAMAADPDLETRTLNRRLDDENGALRAELSAAQAQLATPEKMTAVLRDLISAQKDLELISIRSGKIEDLLAPPAAGSAPVERGPSIFRHGIEVSVRGDYRSLTAYLKSLEGLQWKARLADLVLTTDEYPRVTMSFTLYTLSLERAWLGF